jgi:GTP-binding protein YchF
MNLKIGIVGLPNVGKSTLFNALLKKQQALAANYPFATIEPNVGVVAVPDKRLLKLAQITQDEEKIENPPPIKPATVDFVDIAGLVKGASEGEGLGNKFLSHIREVNVVSHVVRAFEDPNVIREGSLGPREDYETIQTELILSDLQTLSKVLESRKLEPLKKQVSEKLSQELNSGKRAGDVVLTDEEKESVKDLFLLTNKKEIIVLNVSENYFSKQGIEDVIYKFSEELVIDKNKFVVVSAKIESDLSSMSEDEQKEYLKDLGVEESGLERLIKKAYEELGLISFLTTGEKEVKAWTVEKGINAQNASGAIHTDFIKKFIKAEVVSFDDFVENNGWKGSREKGKARLEGRDYIVKDGEVIEFKIGT